MRLNVTRFKFSSFAFLLACSLSLQGQTLGPEEGMNSKAGIFFSNAKMYVGENVTNADEPTMFIQGSAKFSNAAQITQQGVTALTGDFISVKDGALVSTNPAYGALTSLFYYSSPTYPDDPNVKGTIRFVGQWNKQVIKRESFHYGPTPADTTTVYASEKFDDPSYILNFPKIQVRKDGISPSEIWAINQGITDPSEWYTPDAMGFVSVATNIALQVAQLDISGFNRFSVDGTSAGIDTNSAPFTASGSTGDQERSTAANHYKVNYGYADIRKLTENGVPTKPGQSEVNLKLYNYTDGWGDTETTNAQTDPKVLATNTYSWGDNGSGGKKWSATFLRGFTPPFKALRSDYMFYHVLTVPEDNSMLKGYTDEQGKAIPVEDPRYQMNAGRGYFYAMDVSRVFFDEISNKWVEPNSTIGHTFRARGGYNFSRLVNEYSHNYTKWNTAGTPTNTKLNLFPASTADGQRFNDGEVIFRLKGDRSLNILGNPYMTPISLTPILGQVDGSGNLDSSQFPGTLNEATAASTKYKNMFVPQYVGNEDPANPTLKVMHYYDETQANEFTAGPVIRSSYWVVSSAFVLHAMRGTTPVYAFNAKYDYVDVCTTPGTIPNFQNKYIEPMQMFLLQAATEGDFKFNHKMKVFSGEPFEPSIDPLLYDGVDGELDPVASANRNARTRATDLDNETSVIIPNWFVVEAMAKGEHFTADRTAVRFYTDATIGYDSYHDQEKKMLKTSATDTKSGELAEEMFAPTNIIYTSTPLGQPLAGNAIGFGTKEIPLHYIPSEREEEVTIKVYGLEGMDLSKVEGVWLIDREQDNYKQDLLEDNQYTFVSMPVDNSLEAENRFILRFYESDDNTDDPSITEKPITCYYSGSTLYVGGLNESDLGSKLQIYDLQGRMMGNTIINNYPSMEYQKPLGQGTFIVRITGNRNYTTKFVNLRNY